MMERIKQKINQINLASSTVKPVNEDLLTKFGLKSKKGLFHILSPLCWEGKQTATGEVDLYIFHFSLKIYVFKYVCVLYISIIMLDIL